MSVNVWVCVSVSMFQWERVRLRDINPATSIITLNMNSQHTPIKRQRMLEWIKDTRPNYVIYKTHFTYKDTYRLKVKGQRTTVLALRKEYQAFVLFVNLLVFLFTGIFFRLCFCVVKGLYICFRILSEEDVGDLLGTSEMAKSNAKPEQVRLRICVHSQLVIMKEKLMAG